MDVETVTKLKKLAKKYPFCQSIRQLYLLNLKVSGNDKNFAKELSKTAIQVRNRDILQRELSVVEKIHFPPAFQSKITNKNTLKKKNRLEQSEKLLDKFIETNPSISRLKDGEEDNLPEASDSNAFVEGVVSETLAEIYLKKGLIEEARAVYLQLAEDFPEKREYYLSFFVNL
jgi:tetratricopeptide (TPR) repeat protein